MAGCDLRRKDGFSLVEVLVALSLLAIGLLALAVLQVTAIKGNAVASKWTIATDQAQDRLERFRHARVDFDRQPDPAGSDVVEARLDRLAIDGRGAAQQFVEHPAEAVDVRARIDGLRRVELLGR